MNRTDQRPSAVAWDVELISVAGESGDERAIGALLAACVWSDDGVAAAAAEALSRFSIGQVLPQLRACARSWQCGRAPTPPVHAATWARDLIRVVGERGDRRAIGALLDVYVWSRNGCASTARQALTHFPVQQILSELRRRARCWQGQGAAAPTSLLRALNSQDEEEAIAAAERAASFGGDRVLAALGAQLLSHRPTNVRVACARALGQSDDVRAVAILKEAARRHRRDLIGLEIRIALLRLAARHPEAGDGLNEVGWPSSGGRP